MATTFKDCLERVVQPKSGEQFNVEGVSAQGAYYIGRDSKGRAALLIASSGSSRPAPLQLAGIEARFATPCTIVDASGVERREAFSTILCLSIDRDIEAYFCSLAEALPQILGDAPTTEQVMEAVEGLVDLFQKLRSPARRSLAGLLGELCMIYMSRNAVAAIGAWRVDPEERFDFIIGNVRLDVKSATNRSRSHSISFEQANPPTGTTSIVASVWIEVTGGGVSVGEFIGRIEEKASFDPASVQTVRRIVAESLGDTLPTALSAKFDLALGCSSLLLFDGATIAAIRPPLPSGVSSVRFVSDLSIATPLEVREIEAKMTENESSVLPGSQVS